MYVVPFQGGIQESPIPNPKWNYIRSPKPKTLNPTCSGGNLDIVKLLLELGADMDLSNGRGTTPLMLAAAYGQLEIASFWDVQMVMLKKHWVLEYYTSILVLVLGSYCSYLYP